MYIYIYILFIHLINYIRLTTLKKEGKVQNVKPMSVHAKWQRVNLSWLQVFREDWLIPVPVCGHTTSNGDRYSTRRWKLTITATLQSSAAVMRRARRPRRLARLMPMLQRWPRMTWPWPGDEQIEFSLLVSLISFSKKTDSAWLEMISLTIGDSSQWSWGCFSFVSWHEVVYLYGLYSGRFATIAARTGVLAPEFQDNIYVLCWAFVGPKLGPCWLYVGPFWAYVGPGL